MEKRSEESQETTDDVMAQLETYSDRILLIDQMKCRVNKYFKVNIWEDHGVRGWGGGGGGGLAMAVYFKKEL